MVSDDSEATAVNLISPLKPRTPHSPIDFVDFHRAICELIDAHNAPILERVRATEAYQNLAKQIK